MNTPGSERTSLKGKLRGHKIDAAAGFFGVSTPIRNASFNVDYDLHWRNLPWQPDEASLMAFYVPAWGKVKLPS